MLHESALGDNGDVVCIDLRPDRSLSGPGLAAVFLALAAFVLLVAGVSAGHGNVYAPLFCLIELPFVGAALWWATRRLRSAERVQLSSAALVVRRSDPGQGSSAREWRFDPYWVRVERERRDRRSVLLRSHGKTLEVGAFLSDDERDQLEQLLRGGLMRIRRAREPITSEQELP